MPLVSISTRVTLIGSVWRSISSRRFTISFCCSSMRSKRSSCSIVASFQLCGLLFPLAHWLGRLSTLCFGLRASLSLAQVCIVYLLLSIDHRVVCKHNTFNLSSLTSALKRVGCHSKHGRNFSWEIVLQIPFLSLGSTDLVIIADTGQNANVL